MTPRIRTVRDERGVALPLALFGLMLLSGVLLAFLAMSANEPLIAQNLGYSNRAFYVADAGIEHGWAALPDTTVPAGTTATLFGGDQAFGGGSYNVTARNNADGTYLLTSTGIYKDSTQAVLMLVRLPGLPSLPAAITSVSNGSNELSVENASFVTGNEESGAASCTSNKPGWVWKETVAKLVVESKATLAGSPQQDRAYMAGTDDPMFGNPTLLRNWISVLAALPGVVNVDSSSTVTNDMTLGTAASPQITVWDPSAGDLRNNMTGYGILIIKGNGSQNLNFNNNFLFNGLILIDSVPEAHFTSNAVVHGAVIAVSEGSGSQATHVEFENNAILKYNCASLTSYTLPLAGKPTMLGWKRQ